MITSLLATFGIVIIFTVLATFVVARAGDGLPARLFVAVTAALVVMNVCNLARFLVTDPLTGMLLATPSLLALTTLEGLLLLLLSALFMPQWWTGTRPIRWIALPYFLVILLLGGDIAAGTGWFVGPIVRSDTGFYRFASVQPGASVLLALSFVGWLVQLALLLVAFARKPPTRPAIGLLFGAIIVGIIAPILLSALPIPYLSHLPHVLVSLPLLVALAYAVLRTRLLIPTPAALNLAIQSLPDPLIVLDVRQRIVYANPAAEALHLCPGPLPDDLAACVAQANRTGSAVRVALHGRQVMMHTTAVMNTHGEQTGTLLLGRDVTELEQRTAELHASERLLQTLIDHLPASILVKDRQQRYMLVNTAYERMLPTITRADVIGLTDEEVMGWLSARGDIPPGEHTHLLQQLVAQWQQEDTEVLATGCSFQQEARLPIGERTRTYLTSKFPLFDEQNAITGIGVIAIDITERKQAEETLRTLSRAIEQSSAAIVITDSNGAIEYVNPSFTQVTGYSLAEASGQNPRILKAGTLAPAVYRELWQHITTGQEWRGELHNRKKNGDVYWEYVSIAPVFDEYGTITHYVAVKEDITERKQIEHTLHERAIRDGLTGLHNRRYLDETLPRELHRATSYQQSVGVIMLDIDHFKRYNDTYGHDAGDMLLRGVSTFLQAHTREGDLVCRYGGEEFTLVLPGASLTDTQQRAEQIRAGIQAQAVEYEGHVLTCVTISSGVAVFPDHGATADEIIKIADQALYQAKHSGRNCVVVAPQGRGDLTAHMASGLP